MSATAGIRLDVDEFLEVGFVALRGALPRDLALRVRRVAEELVAASSDGPWRTARASVYDAPVLVEAMTPPVRAAVDVLAGAGRWHCAAVWGFPSRFPGGMDPTWHIDGDWFTHHVTSGEQVLTPIFMWDDVGDNASPTLLCPGSHRDVARWIAAREPEGVGGEEITQFVHSRLLCEETAAATGAAGDVILCHPLLAHSVNPASPNGPRYISNVAIHAYGPLNVKGPTSSMSPVELAISRALA